MSIATQDENGNWVPAKPLEMTCEHRGCKSTIGKDYKPKKRLCSFFHKKDEWDEEPVFLCDKHAKGFQPVM